MLRLYISLIRPDSAIFLSVIWQSDHVEVRAEITAPEAVRNINGNIAPGAGFIAGTDKWAVPISSGVQTGNFVYPGGITSIYPSSNQSQFATPSGGWMAFWNEGINEVHGFTYTGAYQLQVANGAATDLNFIIPPGDSRVSFHVVKPKPAQAYDALKTLALQPILSLTQSSDKLFAGVGNEITYTFKYQNTGNAGATNVRIEVVLPAGLDLVAGSISNGGMYDPATRLITWNIGAVAAGDNAQNVTFRVTIAAGFADGTKFILSPSIRSNELPAGTSAPSPNPVTVASLPTMTKITPDKGGNAGYVTVTITGQNIDPKATVKLTKAGQADIVGTVRSGSPDGSFFTVTFDLRVAQAGLRDVVITNPGGQYLTISNAFTIVEGGEAKLWVEIVGMAKIRPGREQMYSISYGNRGNVDASDVPLFV